MERNIDTNKQTYIHNKYWDNINVQELNWKLTKYK